jgi:hypothetical protein
MQQQKKMIEQNSNANYQTANSNNLRGIAQQPNQSNTGQTTMESSGDSSSQ